MYYYLFMYYYLLLSVFNINLKTVLCCHVMLFIALIEEIKYQSIKYWESLWKPFNGGRPLNAGFS